jgi:membrane peptidoglycan carboxypeptidase
MAGSYATFAASGKQRDPFSVTKVVHQGKTISTHQGKTEQAFTAKVADNVTDVLKTVVEDGTGSNAQLPGREVAGKTGTTDGNKSAWFVGYTPQLSTAISMFRYPDDESIKNRTFLEMYGTGDQDKIHGASFPSEIWHDYMEQALKGDPVKKFPTPEPIGEVINDTPPPSPTPTPSETEESSPSPSPTPSQTPTSPSPSPSATCGVFDWECENGDNSGNQNGGNDTAGGDGTQSPSPSASATDGEGDTSGNGNGNGNGPGGTIWGSSG